MPYIGRIGVGCMKKYMRVLTCIFAIFIGISGCSSGSKNQTGTITVSGQTCYLIDLGEDTVEDHFTLVSPKGQVSVALNGELGPGAKGIVARYSKIDEGGWIAYYENLVIYFPPEISESNVQVSCATFRSLDKDSCLSIGEVRKYLAWI